MFDEKIILDFKHNNEHYNEMCEMCKQFPGMSVAFAFSQAFNMVYFNEVQLIETDKNSFENTLGEFFYWATRRNIK